MQTLAAMIEETNVDSIFEVNINIPVTTEILTVVNAVEGIATVQFSNRYAFLILVGKMFNTEVVTDAVRVALKNYSLKLQKRG